MRNDGRGLLESAGGAARMGWSLLTPFLRTRRERWGVEDDEWRLAYPGDELVPQPRWKFMHALTVHAPPSEVWPWVVQLGQGRAGFYSYEGLENLAGCRISNAQKVLPELQDLKPGDEIRLHPKAPALKVARCEPGHLLVLHGAADLATGSPFDPDGPRPERYVNTSWALILEPAPWVATRLLSRMRSDFSEGLVTELTYGRALLEPISEVMDWKMLEGIRARAQAAYFRS